MEISYRREIKHNYLVITPDSGTTPGYEARMLAGLVYVVAVNHGQLDGLTNRQLGFMIILSLYHGFTASGVDNWAHIGGLFSGFILSIFLYRRKHTARISDTGR